MLGADSRPVLTQSGVGIFWRNQGMSSWNCYIRTESLVKLHGLLKVGKEATYCYSNGRRAGGIKSEERVIKSSPNRRKSNFFWLLESAGKYFKSRWLSQISWEPCALYTIPEVALLQSLSLKWAPRPHRKEQTKRSCFRRCSFHGATRCCSVGGRYCSWPGGCLTHLRYKTKLTSLAS